ncbi:MAG: AAA family ATPase [Gammaproteobacteria bacterium]|nr:AAA family ATPase [Gammaproteobacteria bacterium]
MSDLFKEWYRFWAPIFSGEKETENYFSYNSIEIKGFRGLSHVSLNFSKNDLVLLLGLNESGKTSILKAIECFDFNNDPAQDQLKAFFTSIRNKQDIDCSSPTTITAEISFSEPLDFKFFQKALRSARYNRQIRSTVDAFIARANERCSVRITRVIPFNVGNAGASYYKFEDHLPIEDQKLESVMAQEIVRRSPYILYFEDFQDAIPEKIFTNRRSDGFNPAWYEIIDGIFFNTNSNYSVKKYLGYYSNNNRRADDARTVLKQVNNTLQETFTEKWRDLSGVKEIDHTEIVFQENKKYFEIKISEKDGTTYSVHERSKGAVWYLAFLMKTEFRRKKLREGSGKPIYLIDEPASNLHSTAQSNMVADFEKLVEDTTVIYTTHSRYLISESNVKNTHVVSRKDGCISCVKWGEYIKGKAPNVSYYQPLHDCLQIVPNNLDIPWDRAIITEGPSDSATLGVMQAVLGEENTHVIYPGGSASNLSTLISLSLGWSASFKILLDSDSAGKKAKKRYMQEFSLPASQFVMHAAQRPEIERVFDKTELVKLYELAFEEKVKTVDKKQYLALMRKLITLVRTEKVKQQVVSAISTDTKKRFAALFQELKQ